MLRGLHAFQADCFGLNCLGWASLPSLCLSHYHWCCPGDFCIDDYWNKRCLLTKWNWSKIHAAGCLNGSMFMYWSNIQWIIYLKQAAAFIIQTEISLWQDCILFSLILMTNNLIAECQKFSLFFYANLNVHKKRLNRSSFPRSSNAREKRGRPKPAVRWKRGSHVKNEVRKCRGFRQMKKESRHSTHSSDTENYWRGNRW